MKLFVLLAALGAVAVAVFFWRKNQESASQAWHKAEGYTSAMGKTAGEKAGKASEKLAATADEVTSAASDIADEVKRTAARQN